MSCGPAGNCAAGGPYTDRSRGARGSWSASGTAWGRATGVPGLAALNQTGSPTSARCRAASAGSCAAGGYYGRLRHMQGFVAAERNGAGAGRPGSRPGRPEQAARAWALSSSRCRAPRRATARPAGTTPSATITCRGSWSASGTARWGRAAGVPGLAALNAGGNAPVNSVSCASAGNCTAGGYYTAARSRAVSWSASGTGVGPGGRSARPRR